MPDKKSLEEELKGLGERKPSLEEELRELGKDTKSFTKDQSSLTRLGYIIEKVCKEDPNTDQSKVEELIREKLEPDEIGIIPGFGEYVPRDAGIWFLYTYRYSLKLKNQSCKEIVPPKTAEEPPLLPLKYAADQAGENNDSEPDQVKKFLREKIKQEEIIESFMGMGPMVHEDAGAWFMFSYKRSLKVGDKAWELFFKPSLEEELKGLGGEPDDVIEELRELGKTDDLDDKQSGTGQNDDSGKTFEELFGLPPVEPEEPGPLGLVERSQEIKTNMRRWGLKHYPFTAEDLQKRIDGDDTYAGLEPFFHSYDEECNRHERDMMSICYIMSKPEIVSKFGEEFTAKVKVKAEEYRKQYATLRMKLKGV